MTAPCPRPLLTHLRLRGRRRHFGVALLAAAAILATPFPGAADFHTLPPAEGEEVIFNYIKGNLVVVRTQHEIAIGHLRNALAHLQGTPDVPAIRRAAHLTHLAYRMLRFAWHGTKMLESTRGRNLANPIYTIVADLNSNSRSLMRNAGSRLAKAGTWTQNNLDDIQEARDMLEQALTLAEEGLFLL